MHNMYGERSGRKELNGATFGKKTTGPNARRQRALIHNGPFLVLECRGEGRLSLFEVSILVPQPYAAPRMTSR